MKMGVKQILAFAKFSHFYNPFKMRYYRPLLTNFNIF